MRREQRLHFIFALLVMLVTSTTAGAQTYYLTLDPNYEGGEGENIPVYFDGDGYHYSLTNFNPNSYPQFTRDHYSIIGWALSSTGPIEYAPNATVTMTGSLTLYAVWDYGLSYTITNESSRTVKLTGYGGDKPTGALEIPASVMIGGNVYAVTSIGDEAFRMCTGLNSVTIPASVTSIGENAFQKCTRLNSVTFPSGSQLISIGQFAFYDTALTSVTIYGSPFIGGSAFPASATVRLNLTANGPVDGYKWMTFYNINYYFQADANTTVYKATVSGGSLVLHEVEDKIVDKMTAVILKSTDDPVLTKTTTESSDTHSNDLQGDMAETATPANCYTLGNGSAGVGFYHYTGAQLGVGKAYLIYTGSESRDFLGMDDETTSIEFFDLKDQSDKVERKNSKIEELKFFDLSGRRVMNPTKGGLYVNNGRKVVIK